MNRGEEVDIGRARHAHVSEAAVGAGRKSKIMLLTGTPPGMRGVGEVFLRDLVLHYGPENVHCAAVVSPTYRDTPDPRLADMSIQLLSCTHLQAHRRGDGRLAALGAFCNYLTSFGAEVRRLTDSIVENAHVRDTEQVLAVLNYPLLMPLARRVAQKVNRPLTALIWDPPSFFIRDKRFDRVSGKMLLTEFERTLRQARRVAVMSEPMRDDYAALTNAPIYILRHGLPPIEFEPPSIWNSREWIIGFAGRMYAQCAWQALLDALDRSNWSLAGRPVRIKLFAPWVTLASRASSRIEYLGYPSPEESQRALSECHVTYLPQPFAPYFGELSRYSFPTKLTSYLSVGRPVFAHCPADSALARFVNLNPVGALSTSLEPAPIIAALESLLSDEQAYERARLAAMKVAREQFDAEVFNSAVDELLRPDTHS